MAGATQASLRKVDPDTDLGGQKHLDRQVDLVIDRPQQPPYNDPCDNQHVARRNCRLH